MTGPVEPRLRMDMPAISAERQQFKDNLQALFTRHRIRAKIDPQLEDYLFYLSTRDERAAKVSDEVRQKYAHLLEHIGSKMIGMLDEFDKAKTSGKGFAGFAELLALQAHHSTSEAIGESADYEEIEFLTSSLADRELPFGATVVLPARHPQILWKVGYAQEHGGAFIAVLTPCSGEAEAIIICRGTAGRKTATGSSPSLMNDMLAQIGMKGVLASWPHLKTYLEHNRIDQVEVLGKSMGGAVAQQLGVMIQGSTQTLVKKVGTLQSTGVHDEVHACYQELVDVDRGFDVVSYRHAQMTQDGKRLPDDLVPKIGGYHLGKWQNRLKVYDVRDATTEGEITKAKTKHIAYAKLVVDLMRGIRKTHQRQLRLHKGGFIISERDEKKVKPPKQGAKRFMEQDRQKIASLLWFLSPKLSFRQLFEQEKMK